MLNYKRLFGEAVSESVRDYAEQNKLVRPGYWMARFVRNGPFVPMLIEWCDHEPGNPANILDTGPYLIAIVAGEHRDPIAAFCAHEKRPISRAEYLYQIADLAWCRQYKPDEPKLSPHRRIDPLKAALPF